MEVNIHQLEKNGEETWIVIDYMIKYARTERRNRFWDPIKRTNIALCDVSIAEDIYTLQFPKTKSLLFLCIAHREN